MYNVLKLNKISPLVEKTLGNKYATGDNIANPDAVIVRSAKMADYAIGDKLLCVGRAGAGVNNIPVEKMAESGVVVFNTPGSNANAVKELVICGMLLASRDMIGGNKWVNTLTENVAAETEKGKSNFGGYEIAKKTLGIIGLGAIGVLVANACVGLGMNVIGFDPAISAENAAKLDKSVKVTDLETVYKESDIISLNVPFLPATKQMINESTIAKMKKGVIIINAARGELVDTAAVKVAIADKKVAKYVVDFPDETVLNVENIIVLPHLGASTEEAEETSAEMAAHEIAEYIENGNIINSVNYPNLKKEKNGAVRTCVLFKAADAADIEKVTGDKKVAVRGLYGYAIIDANAPVSVKNAIKVRVI